MTSRAECLAEARQQQADAWPAYIARLRELGPGPMAREVYSPARHEGGIEALEARLAGLLGTGKAAA